MEDRTLAFLHRHRGCTSIAHNQRNSKCRYYGFRGAQQFILPCFRERRRAQLSAAARKRPPYRQRRFKEPPSADPWLLLSTLSHPFHIHIGERVGCGCYFLADGTAKVQNWVNFPPGGACDRIPQMLCVLLRLNSNKIHPKES